MEIPLVVNYDVVYADFTVAGVIMVIVKQNKRQQVIIVILGSQNK